MSNKLETVKTALNELIVAVRGGGDLTAAADAAQTILDELNVEEEDGEAEGEEKATENGESGV